ncbi:alpha-L-arabinofuranosidase C-terminal domain-containing protein [Parabacteroides sp. PF5-9]|uniref:alpha-L-arabinofuranosidase C-terminal domain-containing protein n=1 Tax=Parabacteroides sp. PF5-9 TaxID=1742404 RepID=UPI0024751E24|nr:alpha-L-arabinofuranosidase C-terminal domain-containing protein [Parabacteroides sp. PF5-9]
MIEREIVDRWNLGAVWICFLLYLLGGCRPEMPVTSSITVETEGVGVPVNQSLYGLNIEEINHAIEGGLYGELIQNRSFEDGVPPLNTRYDGVRNLLVTPNKWSIPFVSPYAVPGWRRLAVNTIMAPDPQELLNVTNKRSLYVAANASVETGRGGVVAEGYDGILLEKGERYHLSFYAKSNYLVPRTIDVALEDSSLTHTISDVFSIRPSREWKKYQYTFTAHTDATYGALTFSTDTAFVFWLDVVSLFPEKTWNNRSNGLRIDLMEKIVALNPQFIRFPGGPFVEGYTAGTFPLWKESVGDISQRKHFWNIWGYGSSNGMGYHEYLQLCEDLKAEPVYVVNSGVTSQSRRPRYEAIGEMDKLVQDALDAIAYANEPADSLWGSLRAENGHPTPFHLKYIEIGSENNGYEYNRRFEFFRQAIQEVYPEVMVISSAATGGRNRSHWVDHHFHSGEDYLISNYNLFESIYSSRRNPLFIGEFGVVDNKNQGTMRAAIAEACFLIGAENNQQVVKRLAYSPVLGNAKYAYQRPPMIAFKNKQILLSPSYYLWELLANHRGDELLKTSVETYAKPQVRGGYASIELFDNCYDITDVCIDQKKVTAINTITGGWKIEDDYLIPEANSWNYAIMGDSSQHNYELTATIQRTKGSGTIQFRIRDNGELGDQSQYLSLTIGGERIELHQQSLAVSHLLTDSVDFPFESHRWYKLKLTAHDDRITCSVNDTLIFDGMLKPLPSLVATTALDNETGTVFLKVVNTTQHEEITRLQLNGIHLQNEATVIQLKGLPEDKNTFEDPDRVIREEFSVSFPLGRPMNYTFPPNSITLLKLIKE